MEHAPYVVAIAGGTCSGKSTLCDRLENTFARGVRQAGRAGARVVP